MNQSHQSETDAIRSEIDTTRRRMDDTMDALGDRLQPRHLVDEFLGYIRGSTADGDSRMNHLREKVTHSCENAMHTVVSTVKQNPMPALLIGAGVGWMIYESMRDKSAPSADGNYYGYSREGERLDYDPDMHYDRPLEYPPALAGAEGQWTDQGGEGGSASKLGEMKHKIADKASHAGEAVRDKAGALKHRAGEKLHAVRERAGAMTSRMRDGTREAYTRTRERVVHTADRHPLETGFVALAAGLLVGLALPTPAPVNRTIGATADRLRDRTREAGSEMFEKGKRVANAAVTALKDEAQAQGLTPEAIRQKASAVAQRGAEAGQETARQEGLGLEGNQSGSEMNDTSGARPNV